MPFWLRVVSLAAISLTIEIIMPLAVHLAPARGCSSCVYRLKLLIETDRGQRIYTVFPITKVTRSGFAVVEWGGVMENEQQEQH